MDMTHVTTICGCGCLLELYVRLTEAQLQLLLTNYFQSCWRLKPVGSVNGFRAVHTILLVQMAARI